MEITGQDGKVIFGSMEFTVAAGHPLLLTVLSYAELEVAGARVGVSGRKARLHSRPAGELFC